MSPDVPAAPLRRLTRGEYNNTVRDLLADTTAPADKFPPDEVSGGFSNNSVALSVPPLLAEKYMEAAEALAATAVRTLPALLPCAPTATTPAAEDTCARQFIERFGRRAYRRPLAADDVTRLLKVFTTSRAGASFARGIEIVMQAILQSPSFLYRFETGVPGRAGDVVARLTSHEVAVRLSYLLFGTMPDDKLAAAADANQLATADQVGRAVRTMLDDPRARPAVLDFYRQWLGLVALDKLTKDARTYPEMTDEVRAAMRAETPALVEHVMWTGDRRLETLLTAPLAFVSAPLAKLYGVGPSTGKQPSMLDPAQRSGILTQTGLLAVYANADQSSPVLRGKFVREQLMCQDMPPAPPDLMVAPPEVNPKQPTRERFAAHRESPACSICHELMDPIGVGFEAYDGIGRFRTTDGGRAVETAGAIVKSRDLDGKFQTTRELAGKLGKSAEVRTCVTTQWFRFALGRVETDQDRCSLQKADTAFAAANGDLRELLIALAQTDSFLFRRVAP